MDLSLEIDDKKYCVQECKNMLKFTKTHTYAQLVQKLIKIKPIDRYSDNNLVYYTGLVPGNVPDDISGYPRKASSKKLYLFNRSPVESGNPILTTGPFSKKQIIEILKDDVKYWKHFLVKYPKDNNINFELISNILEDTSADLNSEDYGLASDDISAIDTDECPVPDCLFDFALNQIKNDVSSQGLDDFDNDLIYLKKHFPECNLSWV